MDESPNPRGCQSTARCFWIILNKSLPGGTFGEVLETYLLRVLFNMGFSLREEAQQRVGVLSSGCCVCGFMHTSYGDIGMPSPTSDQHTFRGWTRRSSPALEFTRARKHVASHGAVTEQLKQ